MIAIHKNKNDFSSKWIDYCQKNRVKYRIVNCYDSNIVEQLRDCDALMWHFMQANPKDYLFAKQLVFALQAAGKKVFPNTEMAWHFDDKVGQKYLLEALGLPMVPTYVFYDEQEALQWVNNTDFPKVFKLRKGAGSNHVKLAKSRSHARRVVKKAFSSGFSQYNKIDNLKERWYKYRNGKNSFWNVTKGVLRFFRTTEFARIAGPERGYIYFQEFIDGNEFDIRVIVIDGKAFAIKRLVRADDFRASGSGNALYEKHHFDEKVIQMSLDAACKIKSQCLSLDYVFKEGKPLIVEISYGFPPENFIEGCAGYWDHELKWHAGPFNAQGWMVELLLNKIKPNDTD